MTASVLDTSRPSSPTDVDTMTFVSPLLKPSRSAICSFCFRPPFACPTSIPTLAPGTEASLPVSISQVSLYWVNTITLEPVPPLTVLLTRDRTLETFGCSTFERWSMVLMPMYSGRLTISLALFPPFSWSASASIFSRYILRGVIPWVSASPIACRSLMHMECSASPL